MQADHELDFWFHPDHQPYWFSKDDKFDRLILEKFSHLHIIASRGELWS